MDKRHGIVYAERGMYAGWPANHGAWQWGDEFLVGFLRGPYSRDNSMHHIGQPFELMQARSYDGGESWSTEPTGIPLDMPPAFEIGEITQETILRVRGVYDHGGDFVDEGGGYYASDDKGNIWRGPFAFAGLEDIYQPPIGCTSRSRTLGDLIFMSRADMNMWGTDDVFCARMSNGRFTYVSDVANDKGRAVMPAVARIGRRIVAVCRRRISNRFGGWIEAYGSDDEGVSWRSLGEVGETGKNNGNPPALIAAGSRLVCVYGNRTDRQIVARVSDDAGSTWGLPLVLRDGGKPDIGYPQLFAREDGALVAVYYWADAERKEQHIASTIFSV